MHKIISAVALFAFAGTLLSAESPFVGTWKYNAAESKYSTGQPPKDLTIVIEEQGDNLHIAATGTNADGSPLSVKYTVPVKGGEGKMEEGPYDAISSKTISTYVRENTYSKNGKVVATRRTAVSKDGKTLKSTVKGMSTTGKTIAGTDVYDKQ